MELLFAACLRCFWDFFWLFQDASLKTEGDAQVMGEIVEQAEIPLPNLPLKMKNLPSEREFYIPSVDLLTAQVKMLTSQVDIRQTTLDFISRYIDIHKKKNSF